MGYLKSIGTVFIYIGLLFAILAFVPGLPPDADFSEYNIKLPAELKSPSKPYNRLDHVEVLFDGEISGPESFASYNGELYTTVNSGDVVKIVGKHIVPIVKFGKPCDPSLDSVECGRPLGLKFDKNGALYVIDAYKGIFKVDVGSGKYTRIVDITQPIEGKLPKLPNSLDITSNGDIYWTDSSTDFQLVDGLYTFLANPSGRLIWYNAATKKNTVVVQNLGFANGVVLSEDESFVLVAESLTSRITKFNLKGPKKGGAEPFIEGLPGLPDNLHSDGQGGFFISLVAPGDAQNPLLFQSLMPHPYLRKACLRLLYLLELPFKRLDEIYPNYYTKKLVHVIGSFGMMTAALDSRSTILRVNKSGKIIDVLYSNNEKVSSISSAFVHKDYLYLGSPWNQYLLRVPLKHALPNFKVDADNLIEKEKIVKREAKEPVRASAPSEPSTPSPVPTTPRPVQATPQTTPKPVATPRQPPPPPAPVPQQPAAKPVVAPKPTPAPAATPPTPVPAPSPKPVQVPQQAPPKPVQVPATKPVSVPQQTPPVPSPSVPKVDPVPVKPVPTPAPLPTPAPQELPKVTVTQQTPSKPVHTPQPSAAKPLDTQPKAVPTPKQVPLPPDLASQQPTPKPIEVQQRAIPNPATIQQAAVPNPTIIPQPAVPNPAVPSPQAVPSPATRQQQAVPSPATPQQQAVPKPAVVAQPAVPNPAIVSSQAVPKPATVPSQAVPKPATIPQETVPKPVPVNQGAVPPANAVPAGQQAKATPVSDKKPAEQVVPAGVKPVTTQPRN